MTNISVSRKVAGMMATLTVRLAVSKGELGPEYQIGGLVTLWGRGTKVWRSAQVRAARGHQDRCYRKVGYVDDAAHFR